MAKKKTINKSRANQRTKAQISMKKTAKKKAKKKAGKTKKKGQKRSTPKKAQQRMLTPSKRKLSAPKTESKRKTKGKQGVSTNQNRLTTDDPIRDALARLRHSTLSR